MCLLGTIGQSIARRDTNCHQSMAFRENAYERGISLIPKAGLFFLVLKSNYYPSQKYSPLTIHFNNNLQKNIRRIEQISIILSTILNRFYITTPVQKQIQSELPFSVVERGRHSKPEQPHNLIY